MSLTGPTPLPIDQNGREIQNTYRNMVSGNGTVTTSGTAVQLPAHEAKIIDIINPTSNADVIVVGDSTVKYSSLKGIPIEPGFTYRLNIQNLDDIWVDAAGNGYTFSYNYYY